METSNFDQLLEKYLAGDLPEKEKKKLEAWLDVMKSDDGDDMELNKKDEELLFQKITGNIHSMDDITQFRPAGFTRPFYRRTWFKLAASVMVFLAASLGVFYFLTENSAQYFITGEREKMILNDGTIVWLTSESKLTYFQDPVRKIRHAALEGEALFEVAKDPDMPFSIRCGTITVKVIGTSFNVKTARENLELEVLTGKVNLSSDHDSVGIYVSPNQKVIYSGSGAVKHLTLDESEREKLIKNTDYDMQFANTSMDKIFERIENKFDVEIDVGDGGLTRCTMTADFTDQSLEKTFFMISELLDINYTISNKTVKVSGKGCN